ncbi:MAG: coenzyme F420-0:L-glutamate ligase [Anaerolineales bacterium]|nr:coenzyme F420-0:L-glutamate ligase [Anaerolineales bacterium]
MTLTITPLAGIPLIRPGDPLADILLDAIHSAKIEVRDGDVLSLAQKIVSKAEGRYKELAEVTPSAEAIALAQESGKDPRFCELILQESSQVLRVRQDVIIVEHKLGFICANAGIDHSNIQFNPEDRLGQVLLLPENPDQSAALIRQRLENELNARLGIQIIDSHGRAWRKGTVGITIGLAGLPGLVDLRGSPDLFERKLEITQVGAADELAAAASLVMGQAAEGIPAVHIHGFPYLLRTGSLKELLRPEKLDLFR